MRPVPSGRLAGCECWWAGCWRDRQRCAGVGVGPALRVSPAGWGLVSEGLEDSCCSAGGLAWPYLSLRCCGLLAIRLLLIRPNCVGFRTVGTS
eukprot:333928-Chlamydomonas_euryale.AAC.1